MRSVLCPGLLAILLLGGCGATDVEPQVDIISLDDLELLDNRTAPMRRTEPAPPTYTVRKGDTLFRIAQRYGLAVDDIKRRNGLTSNVIKPGMVLQLQDEDGDSDDLFDLFGYEDAPAGTDRDVASSGGPATSTSELSVHGYQWPVSGRIVERFRPGFGVRGIEISARHGTPVAAVRDGTVVFRSFLPGLGNVIVVEHAHKYMTLYGYMAAIKVHRGDKVTRGQTIGTVGSSGRVREPRLHFRVYVNYGNADNPLRLLPGMNE